MATIKNIATEKMVRNIIDGTTRQKFPIVTSETIKTSDWVSGGINPQAKSTVLQVPLITMNSTISVIPVAASSSTWLDSSIIEREIIDEDTGNFVGYMYRSANSVTPTKDITVQIIIYNYD